jgi:hypothetical protein
MPRATKLRVCCTVPLSFNTYKPARPDATLAKRAEIEAFSYAGLVQGYHDVDLTEPKVTKALSEFIDNNQPAPLSTTNPADKDGDGLDDKTGEESLVWPDGLDGMDDNGQLTP